MSAHTESMLRLAALALAVGCGLVRAATADDQSFAVTMNMASDSVNAIGGDDLYLDVTLNGGTSGLAHFGYRDGALWATNATLHQLGFVLPAGTPDPVRVSSVRGVQVTYDQAQQSVAIVAPLQLLQLATQKVGDQQPQAVTASTSPGAVLNYSVYGIQSEHGVGSLSAFTELRAFNSLGVLSTTALSQATLDNGNVANNAVRLDSSWSTSFPDKLLTLRVGDALTGATAWSRATRFGGIQFGTNFALQPYLVTTPLIAFFGQATLPSQVELLVNGIRQYSGSVPAGPFQLNSVPRINGAGTAQVVLTDALGRVNAVDFSLYNSQQLLQKGLSDWSAEIGRVREDYGLRSFEYGHDTMASATWRFGVTDNFTAEGHAETTSGLTNGGVGAVVLLGTAGVASASAASSRSRGTNGSQISLGYNWTDGRYNFAVNATQASEGFRDVASLDGSAPARLSANGQAGFGTRNYGSFGIGYLHLHFQDETNRYGSAYWFKSINQRLSLSFNVNQNLDQSSDRSIFLGFNLSLDNRTFVSSGIQNDGS
ncbi:MAG: fimbria/pilus outer membrane usher protein, partial [Dokdonella sp.]